MATHAQAGDATLAALHELSRAASAAGDPVEVARSAAVLALPLLQVDGAVVYAWDPAVGRLTPLWETDSPASEAALDPGEGAIGRAFLTAEPVAVDDYAAWEHAIPASRDRGMASGLAVPMLVGDRPVGALGVWTYRRHRFTAEQSRVLALFAAQVAQALVAARRAAERDHQAAVLAALNDLARAASGLLEPAALARLAVDRARDLLGAQSAALAWTDRTGEALVRLADNDPDDFMPEVVNTGEGLAGEVFRTGVATRVGDYQHYPHAHPLAIGRGTASAAAVPLLVGDRRLGALVVRSERRDYFDDAKLSLISLLAAQVAPAFEAARLHADLAGSEGRFRSLFETLACGVLVQGAMGEVLDANRAAEEMLGLSLEEMRGRYSADLWAVETEGSSRPAMLALQSRTPIRNHLMRIRRRDGEVRWLQADSIPVPGADGSPVQVVSSMIDVTERHRAEEALRESEERFRAVFDRSGIGICRVDLQGRIEDVNPALCVMLGRDRSELIGTLAADLVDPEDWREAEMAAVASGELGAASLELRCRRPDGTPLWGNTTLTAVVNERGRPAFLIAMIEDITARKAQETALEHQALHDALTELPNRTLLHDRLHQAIRVAQREGRRLALLMMDLDRFKEVNDTFGHHSGDVLLREVAARLRRELRGSDTIARLGGDEFAVVLSQADGGEGAVTTARKLLRALEHAFTVEGEAVHIGASLGIAVYPDHGADADLLMRHADVAMYVAKRSGSGYSVYAAESDDHTPGRLALVSDLRHAIDSGQLELHFQPEVELATGRVAGLEALVRWRHPTVGLLPPDQFIALAEHTGLIRPLGLWVLRAAIEQQAAWQAEGRAIPVAVNLSMRNLHDPLLADAIRDLVAARGVDPALLKVEITESTLMADPEHAMKVVKRLEELGIGLSIDDFGTGYSSLAYLRRLPVSEIKIDRSFVGDLAAEENARVIVRSTIDLGHNLGLRVVAEGVEDERALELVTEAGCDLAQGHLLCPAVRADELPARLGPRWLRGSAES